MGKPKKIKEAPIVPATDDVEVRVLEEIHPQQFDLDEELQGNEAFWAHRRDGMEDSL